jgi:hypothetical protein
MPPRPLVEPPDQLVDLPRIMVFEERNARVHAFTSVVSVLTRT